MQILHEWLVNVRIVEDEVVVNVLVKVDRVVFTAITGDDFDLP